MSAKKQTSRKPAAAKPKTPETGGFGGGGFGEPAPTAEAKPQVAPMMDDKPHKTYTPDPERPPRLCYAIVTLVDEVRALYPEAPYEVSNVNGRNTALDVAFDLTAIPEDDREVLVTLLRLVEDDVRVASVDVDESQVLVSIKSNARKRNSRDTFDLDGAFAVLVEGEES